MAHNLCTLVVPTYNRPEFLDRLLTHLRLCPWPGPVIVADGSPEPARQANADAIAHHAARGLVVCHLAPDGETSFVRRIRLAMDLVTTPLVKLCADDDFTSGDYARQAIAILTDHPDCAAVAGRTCGIWLDSDTAYGRVRDFAFGAPLRPPARNESNAIERIHRFETDLRISLFYAMRRVGLWTDIADCFCAMEATVPDTGDLTTRYMLAFLYEAAQDHLTVASGTILSVDGLMLGRQYHGANEGGFLGRSQDVIDVLSAPAWTGASAVLIDALAALLPDGGAAARYGLWLRMQGRLDQAVARRRRALAVGVRASTIERLHYVVYRARNRLAEMAGAKLSRGREYAMIRQLIEAGPQGVEEARR